MSNTEPDYIAWYTTKLLELAKKGEKLGTALDLLLVAVILAAVGFNYHRGIFKMLKSFKLLTTFLIALKFKESDFVSSIVGRIVNFDSFRVKLKSRFEAMWGDTLNNAVNAEVATGTDRFDGIFGGIIDKITNITDYCREAFASGTENFVDTVLNKATDSAETFFAQLIGFLIVFVVAFILLTVICWILSLVMRQGIFRQINRLLGGIYGIVVGIVFAWAISVLVINLVPMFASVEQSTLVNGFFGIAKWFNNNFILSDLFGITKI